jgi:tripartite ATP-independent transporter DctM subunit
MSPLIPSQWESIEAPVMQTEPPGPRSREILARIGRHAYPGLSEGLAPFALASKRAWTVTDADANVYLDLASASASVPLGAGRAELIEPAVEALARFGNEDSHALASELTAELGERLLALAPPSVSRFDIALNGTEAVEIAVKMMRRGGYDDDFTAAITASASIIGPIIPPSIPLVLYGAIARESVGKLFLGGAIPGVLVGLSLMVYIYIVARKRNYPVTPRPTVREILIHCRRVFLPILTPFIILGGIVGGFFTPTEAAAVACLYAFILGKFIYKAMTWKDCFKAFFDTAVLTGVVVFIMGMAGLWSWMITNEGLATVLVEYLTSLTKDPLIMLFLMNLILLILGCFIEPLAIMIMVLPVFLPILQAYQISTVHFGVVMTLALMIGLLTPPFGECLFLLSAITGLSVGRVAAAVAPCLIYIIAVLVLITIFPGFVTWLPSLFM